MTHPVFQRRLLHVFNGDASLSRSLFTTALLLSHDTHISSLFPSFPLSLSRTRFYVKHSLSTAAFLPPSLAQPLLSHKVAVCHRGPFQALPSFLAFFFFFFFFFSSLGARECQTDSPIQQSCLSAISTPAQSRRTQSPEEMDVVFSFSDGDDGGAANADATTMRTRRTTVMAIVTDDTGYAGGEEEKGRKKGQDDGRGGAGRKVDCWLGD